MRADVGILGARWVTQGNTIRKQFLIAVDDRFGDIFGKRQLSTIDHRPVRVVALATINPWRCEGAGSTGFPRNLRQSHLPYVHTCWSQVSMFALVFNGPPAVRINGLKLTL